ncbi:MarR family transcriptional regulator [Bacillus taeanensis]|nr:MarR family transcriptional regulator [Bacillus taeanensis]
MELSYLHVIINLVRGLNKALEHDLENAAKHYGLTAAEHHILCIVFVEKEATMTQIAEKGLWDVSTVMQVIKRLKEKELVTSSKRPNDRRVTYVKLTEKGLKLQKQSFFHEYRLFNYIDEKLENGSEVEQKEAEIVLKVFRELNEHFHGQDFVNWIFNSQKKIELDNKE